eukprot:jgi/Tetstr1/430798/TSEL_020582.t2
MAPLSATKLPRKRLSSATAVVVLVLVAAAALLAPAEGVTGAHGSGSEQRFARQPTGSGGAAERPDLLELAQSGRVGAKSVSAEDDYLAVPELLQRAESGYEAVQPVSRVPGLFPLSTDLTNEYLKQDDRRLPAQEEYLWMSCFGAHMAALFVALDELLPYVPATNHDFTPYLARARNHAEAIDKAFRFRLAFLRKLNEIKRRLQLQVAGVGEDVAADVDAAAKDAFGSDELGQRTLDLLSSSLSAQTLKSYAGRLSQFAEFCHDSENISPLEATTATVVRYVAWIGERGHIAAKSLQPYLSAINTFFELHNLVPIAKDSLHLTSARRGLMLRQRRLDAAPLRVPLPADVAYRFVSKAELIVSAPYPESHLDYRALLASVVNFLFFARGLTGVSCRAQDVHVDTYNITLQIYREKGRAGRRGPDDLRVLLLPVPEHPRVARLLRYFIDNVQSVPLVTVGLAASNFWAVNVAEQSKPWTAATMSDWLSTAVNLVNAAPPAGTSWTSHSLRKGAASAANAIGAPLSHIRYQGGWATNSDVVLDYIDPNVLPSPRAWFFFGHIAPLRHFQVQQDSAAVAFPLHENQLRGTVPAQLSALSGVTSLALYENALTGTIPAQLSVFSYLTYLGLHQNALTGTIPAQLSALSSLEELRFDCNTLTGTVPAQLSALSSLTELNVSINFLDWGGFNSDVVEFDPQRSAAEREAFYNDMSPPPPICGPPPHAALDARIRKRNAPLDPEHVGHEVYNMHVTLPDELSMPPLRLLHINAVAHRWEHLPVYEVVPSVDYIEVPYCEAGSDYWDQTCMLSWRWAMGKPSAMSEGATAMSEQQFAELRHKLRAAAEVGLMYVWIDWSCVPQYVGDPMVEIHRSRLYYARARTLIVLPGFRQLSTIPVMTLKRIIDAKAVASREYFGRVWTLAERMARHARKEKLCEWLSLDLWLGMVVDAMLGGKDDAAAAIYWQKLFPSDVLQQLSEVEQEISLAVEAFHTTKDLYKAVAELCRSGYRVWTNTALKEEASREWLKTYLLEEAGVVYSAFNNNDIVWSIYCFFCFEQDVTPTKALRNLCKVANVDAADSAVYKSILASQEEMQQ